MRKTLPWTTSRCLRPIGCLRLCDAPALIAAERLSVSDRSAAKMVGRITETYAANGVKDAHKDRRHRDVVHGSVFRSVGARESRCAVVER